MYCVRSPAWSPARAPWPAPVGLFDRIISNFKFQDSTDAQHREDCVGDDGGRCAVRDIRAVRRHEGQRGRPLDVPRGGMGRGRLGWGSLGGILGQRSHTSPRICAPRREGWRLSSLDRVLHRPGLRAGRPIIGKTCAGGRKGRDTCSSGALGCAIAHRCLLFGVTQLLSRGRALTDDFR